MNKVAIIVLHYGSKQNTLRCLKSIRKIRTQDKLSVFVVDNGTNIINKKGIQPILSKFHLIKTTKNLGFSGGNNLAIKSALKKGNDFILLLNNDIVVSKKIIKILKNPFNNPIIGITGGIITYYQNPKKIWFAGGYLNKTFCFTRHSFMNRSIEEVPVPEARAVDFVTGAVMMIRSKLLKKIGFLDENYFLYWEDVDFCLRAKKAGYQSYFIRNVVGKHLVSSSSGIEGTNRLSPLRAYYYARNPFLFIKKHNLDILSTIVGQLFIRFPYYMLSIKNVKAFKSYLKGLRDGFNEIF